MKTLLQKFLPWFKKIKMWLQLNDWSWSVAIAFFCYLFVNYGPPQIFNLPMAYFAVNWIQPLIATAGVVAGLYSIARLGMWFNLRKLHDYLYGYKNDEGIHHTPSFPDFKKNITAWQRLLLTSFWLLVFFVVALIVFLKFIPLSAPA